MSDRAVSEMCDGKEPGTQSNAWKDGSMKNRKLYDAITEFSYTHGCQKFNDDDNMAAYDKLVEESINCGLIPEANRKEYSTHGRLMAAIAYEYNRYSYCNNI